MSSCSRIYRDKFLNSKMSLIRGTILDIGGQKINRKGRFIPPKDGVIAWFNANIDPQCLPDVICDAEILPFNGSSVDCVLMCEVLEHLLHPEATINEIHRVLRVGGNAIITMPFLYPVHADPHDMQRWTADRLKYEFTKAGFLIQEIAPMGGYLSVIHDILLNALWRNDKTIFTRICIRIISCFTNISIKLDTTYSSKNNFITTGWGLIALKR